MSSLRTGYPIRQADIQAMMISLILSGLMASVSWNSQGHLGFALLVVLVWALCESRAQALVTALAYYLVATVDLPIITARFYALDGLVG